jgi:hypothetical protein
VPTSGGRREITQRLTTSESNSPSLKSKASPMVITGNGGGTFNPFRH